MRADPELAPMLRAKYARDPLLFIEHWGVTYDPREENPNIPFVMFERQRELVRWLVGRYEARDDGMVEKSRDTGVSWVSVHVAVWLWLFKPGIKVAFGSRKEQLVDHLGDADSIFEKIRILLRNLPRELLPPGFTVEANAAFMRIVNPATGAAITGEAGDNIGRGGRNAIYFKDESAFYDRPKLIDAALSQNSPCKIDISTVNPGARGGPFHKKRRKWAGTPRLFIFDWRNDPRKGAAWYADQKTRHDDFIIASEIDRNWDADVDNVVCPSAWVAAARDWALKGSGPRLAGMDVGGGRDKSVFVVRHGPRVEDPHAWSDPDVINTAQNAAALCKQHRVELLNYDVFGIGGGVMAALKRLPGVKAAGINVGQEPTKRMWPDGRSSREKFLNLKAELWWLLRDRLEKTWQHVQWLESGGTRGQQHPIADMISLPDDDALCGQLSSLTWHRTPAGKIQIETKEQLEKRGVPSPDHADALVLTFAPTGSEIRVRTIAGMY